MPLIRMANSEDVAQILHHSKTDSHFRMSEFTNMPDEDELRFWISDPRSLVIVAVRQLEVVAYAYGFFLSPKWFFFDTILVAAGFRKRGIGERLYDRLRAECKKRGAQLIHGLVKSGEHESLDYWMGLGFEEGSRCIWVEDWLDCD